MTNDELKKHIGAFMRDYSIENLLELHENLYCELMSEALQRK